MAPVSENIEYTVKFTFGEKIEGRPPVDTPIVFLAGEFGCDPEWYMGFCFQSDLPGQELGFYIYPWFLGYPVGNPCFHAPVYRGFYKLILNYDLLDFIKKSQGG